MNKIEALKSDCVYFLIYTHGESMYPIIKNGEKILCKKKTCYREGDIVVFKYENNILVHRLIKIQNKIYLCKGDNSFRIECIGANDIIGVVIINNDKNRDESFLKASLEIGRLFKKCKYNIDTTKKSAKYLEYKRLYLKQ